MIRNCQLSFPGIAGPLPFHYFEASEAHIAGILNGTTYPPIPEIGAVQTILDIGGNVGAASVALAARYPGATVHAFEPGPEPRSLLASNVAAIGRVRVHPFGLHDHDGSVRLYKSRWDPMSASIESSAENTDSFDEIELRRASAVLEAVGIAGAEIVKIDTEGCELPIMRDLGSLVTAARVIYLEYHSEDDRLAIDQLLKGSHILSQALVRQPHRGDLCYVSRDTDFARRMAAVAIGKGS
jgi:FkbM family methyltransferase